MLPTTIQNMRNYASATLLLVCVALYSGCGGPYNASVKGNVKLDDSPLSRGTVMFTPKRSGPSGYGLINQDGTYSIKIGTQDGIPSGDYSVTVMSSQESTPSTDPALPPKPGKPITPIWYRNPSNSPLNFTVTPGRNEINLELKSQPPAGWKSAGKS